MLARRSKLVRESAESKEKARKLWDRKANRAFDEIRRVLRRMATGFDRCMYCEDSEVRGRHRRTILAAEIVHRRRR